MAKHAQKLATRYARSLISALGRDAGQARIGQAGSAQAIAQSLRQFLAEWWSEPLLSDSLQNPMFDKAERMQAIKKIAERAGLPEVAVRFLQVVFERDRISALPQIIDSFATLADEQAGVVKVRVVTAQAVSGDEQHSVEESLRRKIEGTLQFHWEQDPEILGGMLVTYGAKVLDGSLKGRLERIERRLQA